MMTLAQAAALLPQATLVGDGRTPIARVHSDTRSLQPGDLFVALRGERFDAHDFLSQARAAGASAALAERGLDPASLPGLLVPDTLDALQTLAMAWRERFSLPLIAVAGSNGKTTVTQMLAAILRAWLGDAGLATAGNYNNHIGLPLQVLRLRGGDKGHRAAVLELGMNHPGEIAQLAAIAQPTVALVTNAQREHQEFMASVAAVAAENGVAISALPADGVAVYPADDQFAPTWQTLSGSRRQMRFAQHGDAEVTGAGVWQPDTDGGHWLLQINTPMGAVAVALRAPGQHNLRNALAATAAALAAGVPLAAVQQGLQDFRPVAGRSQLSGLRWQGRPVSLVNDSYNANPDSVRAAIDLLHGLPAPHWLVLGDMGEVGDQGPAFHVEVGDYARAKGIHSLWTVGEQSLATAQAFGPAARHFVDVAALITALPQASDFASVLVKGSRFMGMKNVVQALEGLAAAEASHATPEAPLGDQRKASPDAA